MKFLNVILAAVALLSSAISASPLPDRGGIYARTLPDYDINDVIRKWMKDAKTTRRLKNNCNTKGGWEGWAQVELEDEFRTKFLLPDTIREKGEVYKKGKLADIVLPKTETNRGMIIELKCENAFGQKGVKLQDPVNSDVFKQYDVKPAFNDYNYVVLAMAFTDEADKTLKRLRMKPIPRAEVSVPPDMMRTYREDFNLDGLVNDMQDLSKAFYELFLSKSRSNSPAGSPPPSPKPATKPTPKPGKPAPGKGKGKKPA